MKKRKWSFIVIFMLIGLIISVGGCENPSGQDNTNNQIQYPLLRVVNQHGASIISVALVGYEFNNLNISSGNSQTFRLDRGMPAGYRDINVTVRHMHSPVGATLSASNSFNFSEGQTTTITLRQIHGNVAGLLE